MGLVLLMWMKEAGADHLVVAPQRAVEEQQRGAAQPRPELVVERGASRQVIEALARGRARDRQADRILRALCQSLLDRRVFEVEGDLARHAEGFDAQAGRPTVARPEIDGLVECDRPPRDTVGIEHVEDAVRAEHVEHARRRIERELLALAQSQETGDRIDIAVGQDRPQDRAVPARLARLQRRIGQDLRAQIGRRVEQEPARAIGRDGERRLGLRGRLALPGAAAGLAIAVPLRKAAARGGAEHADAHHALALPHAALSCSEARPRRRSG